MIEFVVTLALCGSVSKTNKDAFMDEVEKDCTWNQTMHYVMSTDNPNTWVRRFKKAQTKDYVPVVGGSFYTVPRYRLKKLVDLARSYNIELEGK